MRAHNLSPPPPVIFIQTIHKNKIVMMNAIYNGIYNTKVIAYEKLKLNSS